MESEVVNWRLSRIEEELQNLDFTSEPKMEEDLPPPPDEFINELRNMTPEHGLNGSTDVCNTGAPAAPGIYSEVVKGDAAKQLAAEQKQAIKRIKDKYDKPRLVDNPHVISGVSADFPPAPTPAQCGIGPPVGGVGLPGDQHARKPTELLTSISCPAGAGAGIAAAVGPGGGVPHVQPAALVGGVAHDSPSTTGSVCSHGSKATTASSSLTEQEVLQVEMFFRSHKTTVHVCPSNVKLFFGCVQDRPENWPFIKQGVLVLILNTGETRRIRKLSIVLAEKGTGFIIWKDAVNHLSVYREIHPNFHIMHLSTDHSRMAGFMFDDAAIAMSFIQTYHHITAAHDNILNLSKAKKKDKQKKKYKAPAKSDISGPCCFTHVTKLERPEGALPRAVREGCGASAGSPAHRQETAAS